MRYPRHFRALAKVAFVPLLVVAAGIPALPAIAQSTISVAEWQSRQQSLDQRMTNLNARVQSLLAQCSGSYPIEQLSAMQAQCDASGNVLKAEMAQLLVERDYLLEQKRLIEAQ
jgi:hypothetical protein